MKNFVLLFSIFVGIISSYQETKASPKYNLIARGFNLNCGEFDTLTWDIYLQNASAEPLYYAGGKFVLNFTPSIANGGILSYRIAFTKLPIAVRPTESTISGSTLTLSGNIASTPGEAYLIDPFPGTRVARVSLITTSTTFSGNSFYPTWPDSLSLNSSQVYFYVGNTLTQKNSERNFIELSNCGMFTTSPWECCSAKLLSLNSAIEGLYDSSLNLLNKQDTLTVDVRDAAFPHALRYSSKCRLDSINLSSFHVYTIPWIFPPPTFYLVIRHRNSVETWSKSPVSLSLRDGFIHQYNTTLSDTAAFGNNLKLKGTKYCIYSGDVNQDKAVNLSDVLLVYNDSQNFVTGYVNSDLNGDNLVNLSDISIASNNSALFIRAVTPLD